jgi:translation initiation factor IF-3
LISADGEQLGIVATPDAVAKAREEGLDLVEVSPNADPPVCRLVDYGKYKYQLKKRLQEVKKNQTVIHVKEVKLRPRTEAHDLNFKIRNVKRFLEHGDKAKISVVFRGREMAYVNLGRDLLNRVLGELGDMCVVEQSPKMEGRAMSMVLAPTK